MCGDAKPWVIHPDLFEQGRRLHNKPGGSHFESAKLMLMGLGFDEAGANSVITAGGYKTSIDAVVWLFNALRNHSSRPGNQWATTRALFKHLLEVLEDLVVFRSATPQAVHQLAREGIPLPPEARSAQTQRLYILAAHNAMNALNDQQRTRIIERIAA